MRIEPLCYLTARDGIIAQRIKNSECINQVKIRRMCKLNLWLLQDIPIGRWQWSLWRWVVNPLWSWRKTFAEIWLESHIGALCFVRLSIPVAASVRGVLVAHVQVSGEAFVLKACFCKVSLCRIVCFINHVLAVLSFKRLRHIVNKEVIIFLFIFICHDKFLRCLSFFFFYGTWSRWLSLHGRFSCRTLIWSWWLWFLFLYFL